MHAVTYSTEAGAVSYAALRQALLDDHFENGRTVEQYEASYRGSSRVVFALRGEDIVGTARLLSDGVCNAYIVDMWTRSDLRRQGIGRRMLEVLTSDLQGQHVYLFTDDQVAFYEACGWERQGIGLGKVIGRWLQSER